MSSLLTLLARDEFYSPLFFVIVGTGTLFFAAFFRRWMAARLGPERSSRLEALLERFEHRQRVSLALIAFGAIWLLQLLVETAWAG